MKLLQCTPEDPHGGWGEQRAGWLVLALLELQKSLFERRNIDCAVSLIPQVTCYSY